MAAELSLRAKPLPPPSKSLVVVPGVALTAYQVHDLKDLLGAQLQLVAFHSVGCTVCVLLYLALFCSASPRVRRSPISILLALSIILTILTACCLCAANWTALGFNATPGEVKIMGKLWASIYVTAAWVVIIANATFVPRIFLWYPSDRNQSLRTAYILSIVPIITLIPRICQSAIGAWAIDSLPKRGPILSKVQAVGFFSTFIDEGYCTAVLCYKLGKVGWARRKKSKSQHLEDLVTVVRWTFFLSCASFAIPASIELALFTLSVRSSEFDRTHVWLLNSHMYAVVAGALFACFMPIIQSDHIKTGRIRDSPKFVFKFDADIDYDLNNGVTFVGNPCPPAPPLQPHAVRKRELLQSLGIVSEYASTTPAAAPPSTLPKCLDSPSTSPVLPRSVSSAMPSPASDRFPETPRSVAVSINDTPPRPSRSTLYGDLRVDRHSIEGDSRPSTGERRSGKSTPRIGSVNISSRARSRERSATKSSCGSSTLAPQQHMSPPPPSSTPSVSSHSSNDTQSARRQRHLRSGRSLMSRPSPAATRSNTASSMPREQISTPTTIPEVVEVLHESAGSIMLPQQQPAAIDTTSTAYTQRPRSGHTFDEILRQYSGYESDHDGNGNGNGAGTGGSERGCVSRDRHGYIRRVADPTVGAASLSRRLSVRSNASSSASSDHSGINPGHSALMVVDAHHDALRKRASGSAFGAGGTFGVGGESGNAGGVHSGSGSGSGGNGSVAGATAAVSLNTTDPSTRRLSRSLSLLSNGSSRRRPSTHATTATTVARPAIASSNSDCDASEHLHDAEQRHGGDIDLERYEYHHRLPRTSRRHGDQPGPRRRSRSVGTPTNSIDGIEVETEVQVDVS